MSDAVEEVRRYVRCEVGSQPPTHRQLSELLLRLDAAEQQWGVDTDAEYERRHDK